jgi:hypothetical protein
MEIVSSGTSVEFDMNMFESFLCSGEEQSVWLMLHWSTPGSFSFVSLFLFSLFASLLLSLLHAPPSYKTNSYLQALA